MKPPVRPAVEALRRIPWAVGATLWAAAALTAQQLSLGEPIQPILVFSFVLAAPGAAAVGLVRVGDRLTRAVLAVSVSLVLATIVAQVLLAAGAWSPTLWLALLGGLTAILARVEHTARRSHARTPPETPAETHA